ncbi:MAG: uL15 family ribosomal protein [Thermoplasmata archaeon]
MPSRTRKFRGLRTHGRGIKAGRGAGKQGGRGNAGLHKYKFKSMLIYAPDHFGRHGFKRPEKMIAHPLSINVGELEAFVPVLEAAGALSRDGPTYVADLEKIGVTRLLGSGSVSRPWKVRVAHASEHAQEKVTVVTEDAAPEGGAPTPQTI